MTGHRLWACGAAACGLLASFACGASQAGSAEPVLELIERANDPSAYDVDAGTSPGVRASADVPPRPGVAPFRVLLREPSLAKAPCERCHTVPLAALRHRAGEPGRAHWSVALAHASSDVMTCVTCHAPDDVSALSLLGGRTLGVDHAYEVCAQCHAGQAADWAGGAHGKRLGGWMPPRVVLDCTACHDPHAPALQTRWPARAGRRPQ